MVRINTMFAMEIAIGICLHFLTTQQKVTLFLYKNMCTIKFYHDRCLGLCCGNMIRQGYDCVVHDCVVHGREAKVDRCTYYSRNKGLC